MIKQKQNNHNKRRCIYSVRSDSVTACDCNQMHATVIYQCYLLMSIVNSSTMLTNVSGFIQWWFAWKDMPQMLYNFGESIPT